METPALFTPRETLRQLREKKHKVQDEQERGPDEASGPAALLLLLPQLLPLVLSVHVVR